MFEIAIVFYYTLKLVFIGVKGSHIDFGILYITDESPFEPIFKKHDTYALFSYRNYGYQVNFNILYFVRFQVKIGKTIFD